LRKESVDFYSEIAENYISKKQSTSINQTKYANGYQGRENNCGKKINKK
jgi:hypothetical protein